MKVAPLFPVPPGTSREELLQLILRARTLLRSSASFASPADRNLMVYLADQLEQPLAAAREAGEEIEEQVAGGRP